jgi:hypothetical protein
MVDLSSSTPGLQNSTPPDTISNGQCPSVSGKPTVRPSVFVNTTTFIASNRTCSSQRSSSRKARLRIYYVPDSAFKLLTSRHTSWWVELMPKLDRSTRKAETIGFIQESSDFLAHRSENSSPGNRSVTGQSPDLSNGNSVHPSTMEFSVEGSWAFIARPVDTIAWVPFSCKGTVVVSVVWWTAHGRHRCASEHSPLMPAIVSRASRLPRQAVRAWAIAHRPSDSISSGRLIRL